MTFIYRQLLGVSQKFSVQLLCSRKREDIKEFDYEYINYFPPTFFQKAFSRIKDRIILGPGMLTHHINPGLYKHQVKSIKDFLIRQNISLIHANFGPAGIEILPVAKELNLPLIVSFHGYDASQLLNYEVYRNNLKDLFEYAFVTTPSELMRQNLQEKVSPIKDSEVLHYGIPLEFFNFVKRDPPLKKREENKEIVFLQVSNFVEKKGHEYTIKAFKAVVEEYRNSKLILAGEGGLKKQCVKLSQELGISDKISFPGYVNQSQVKDLMNSADIFVHHSVTASNGDKEGIPNVIMEAMATGLPVVSTFNAGIPELIEDGKDGHMVEERDVDNYSRKLVATLFENGKTALAARKKIETDFNLKLQNKKITRIYSKLIPESQ